MSEQARKADQCQTGCKAFYGGELKHNPHCVFYPESLSEMYDEMDAHAEHTAGLRQKAAALVAKFDLDKMPILKKQLDDYERDMPFSDVLNLVAEIRRFQTELTALKTALEKNK